MSKPVENVDFSKIRYANCWEDAEVLVEGLQAKSSNKILSVASAGDNSFALLSADPELLVAVDISEVQLYLCELKKIAIKNLEQEECLEFLGFKPSTKRINTFLKLKSQLSNEAAAYFNKEKDAMENGIIHQGKFEKYFQLFSQKVLPLIHSKKTIDLLFKEKSTDQQKLFYQNKWNNWRWRLLFKLFFSKAIMGKFGRDPEFLKQVDLSVADYIFNKASEQLQSVQAQKNFILHYNLKGEFGTLLPYYMRKENYNSIKERLDSLHLKKGYAQDAIKEFESFDCMNLSNIFEYMNMEIFRETASELIKGLNKEGRMLYWNLMVSRQLSTEFPQQLYFDEELSEKLTAQDKGFFYNKVLIDQRI